MAKFEVTVSNAQVREKIKDGEHHSRFTDDWADFHYIDIDAPDESQARVRVEARYPPEQGFVIDSVQKSLAADYE